MRSSKKKKQSNFFAEGKLTSVRFNKLNEEESTSSDFSKRSKRQHSNLTYLMYLNTSMHNYISAGINNKIKSCKKLEVEY